LAPKQVGAFALAAALFLTSLLTARLFVANPLPLTAASAASPTSTHVESVDRPTATQSPTATSTSTPPPPTPTAQLRGTVVLDQSNATAYLLPAGCLIHPLRIAVQESDIFALDSGVLKRIRLGARISCEPIPQPDGGVDGVVVQELGDFAPAGDGESLLLLDRAGNVFRYFPESEDWRVERLAHAPQASSRQYLVSISAYQGEYHLLDTNVGQIWRHAEGTAEVLISDEDLRESADLAVGENIYVLSPEGYGGPLGLHKLDGDTLVQDSSFSPPADLADPSLLFLEPREGGHLRVVDLEGRRVRLLRPENGELVREYVFANEEIDVLAVSAEANKLYLASSGTIYVYPREPTGPGEWTAPAAAPEEVGVLPPHDLRVPHALPSLTMPLEGTVISELSFRLPGAPRAYRYGVHEGIDFYWAAGAPVTSTTPVLSVAAGVVIRADVEYDPPTLSDMEDMLARAAALSHTPADILDVLRGRQVWIDHGGGLVSRYCHLSAIAADLQPGDLVEQGQMVAYVGNSGTPASYYDEGSEMHLHLEIRIGEGYLGQYLRPPEVKRWVHQALGAVP
jgi:murein DD-endopeptidase MepM/ murein hydrolase activator NlpD